MPEAQATGRASPFGPYGDPPFILKWGPSGAGKSLPLSAGVLTPTGWKRMNDVRVGDYVCRPGGGASKVVGYYPQGLLPVFKITTSRGDVVRSSADHLWLVRTDQKVAKNWKVRPLQHLIDRPVRKFCLPACRVVDFHPQWTPLDPYFLGLVIGDGSCLHSTLNITTADEEIAAHAKQIAEYHGCRVRVDRRQSNGAARTVHIVNQGRSINPVVARMEALGLREHRAWSKFIPDCYKYNSREVRVALLQGLLDTDGFADTRRGRAGIDTTSPRLAADIVEVVRSLGGYTRVTEGDAWLYKDGKKHKQTRRRYRLNIRVPFVPFRLQRKAALFELAPIFDLPVASIEPDGQEECACITVDDPEGLYVTDGYIITHNSIDDAKAVHETALFIAAPSGGITSITANLRFTPKYQTVETLDQAAAVLQGLIALGPYGEGKNPFRAAVFDDVSVLCKNQILFEESKGTGKSSQGKDDSRKLFLILAKKIQILRYQLRQLRMFGLLNFHDKEPSVDALGVFHRGGPDLASVGQTESLIPIMDVCVRACMEMQRRPWVGVFECKTQDDAQRIYKDRYSVLPARGPLNTGELLRAAGFEMPYPLPWMADMSRQIAEEVEAAAAGATSSNGNGAAVVGGAMPTALGGNAPIPGGASRMAVYSKWMVHLLNQGVAEHLAMWVCQDGLDRAEIKLAHRAEVLSRMGIARGADGTYSAPR